MTRKSSMEWRIAPGGPISKKGTQMEVKHGIRMVLSPYSATIIGIYPIPTHKFLASLLTHQGKDQNRFQNKQCSG